MKVRFSKITLWFTAFGLAIALLDVALSIVYSPTMDPTAERLISESAYAFLLLCPMSLAEAEIPHIHVWTDIAWIYFEVVASNTLIYFVLGSIISFWVNTIRAAIANRPRPR